MKLNERFFQDRLAELLTMVGEVNGLGDYNEEDFAGVDVSTFHDQGILTHNKGLIVEYPDGSVFQLTIVQSDFADDDVDPDDNDEEEEDEDGHGSTLDSNLPASGQQGGGR